MVNLVGQDTRDSSFDTSVFSFAALAMLRLYCSDRATSLTVGDVVRDTSTTQDTIRYGSTTCLLVTLRAVSATYGDDVIEGWRHDTAAPPAATTTPVAELSGTPSAGYYGPGDTDLDRDRSVGYYGPGDNRPNRNRTTRPRCQQGSHGPCP